MLVILGLALLLTACGSSDSDSASATSNITISDAWARAVPADSSTTVTNAVYFVIDNNGDAADQLIGVATDVAAVAEMHQTTMDDGVMQMRQTQEVEIPADKTVAFEPGGLHVMLIGLTRSLKAGETFQLMLTFEATGSVPVDVEVRDL